MKLKVVLEPGEDFGFVAHVPALRGCWTQGASRDEELANVREAIEAWLDAEQEKSGELDRTKDIELVNV